MKKYRSQSALAAVSLVCLLALAACSTAPTLRYITISPLTSTIAVTATQQYSAQAYYSDGTVKDGTALVSWSSSNTAVATIINSSGLATGVAPGTTTITGNAVGTSGATATLTVNQPYTSIVVSCTPASVAQGLTANCTATGNPGAVDISTQVTWNSSAPTIATIPMSVSASPAVAQGLLQGSTNISAMLGTLTSNNFSLTVIAPVANGLTVTPNNPTAAKGTTVPFFATEHFSDGTSGHPLTGAVTWLSGTTTVATILATNTNGSAIASVIASSGTSLITAMEGSLTGTSTLTAAAPVAHYAYAGNVNDNLISGYSVSASNATLTPLAATTGNPWACIGPWQVVVHPSGKYAYCLGVPGATTSDAFVFDILDPTTGALSTPTTTPASGFSFSSIVGTGGYVKGVTDPTGQYLFVLDQNVTTPTVAGYAINQSDGSVSTTAINTLATGDTPIDIMIAKNATGTYLYVVNQGLQTAGSPASVSGYSIGATGTLTALNSGNPYPNGVTSVTSLGNYGTVDPNNAFLYVANGTPDNSVTVFSIAASGTLSAVTGSPFTVTGATQLISVAVEPTDKYLYAVDSLTGNGNVYAFNIVSGGGLSATPAITGSPFAVGPSPIGVSIDPSGTFLAVVNNDTATTTISQFKLAPSTGVLTPVLPAATAGDNALFLSFWVGP